MEDRLGTLVGAPEGNEIGGLGVIVGIGTDMLSDGLGGRGSYKPGMSVTIVVTEEKIDPFS
jgi:hypothetical protein